MPRPAELIHATAAARQAAQRAAEILLDIEAVNFRPDDPYIFTSGRKSPSYVDCRRIISFPAARSELTRLAVELIERDIGRGEIDIVAGGETAGIPFSAWIADALDQPMIYVRKEPKGFGRMAQIEGDLPEGARVLLVEDLTTDGGSKVRFIDALRAAGAAVAHTYVVFHYGIFPESLATMARLDVRLHALATWWDVLDVARARGLYTPEQLDSVEAYLDDPEGWSAARE
ncbi:MAG: orotate phosphoribosyltransferase [Proteobacteria bacterium]|nr:orotate phosphoribosyltransferase [Pseudomonadota bacterium]